MTLATRELSRSNIRGLNVKVSHWESDDLKSTSLKFETRNSNGEKTSRDHNGEPCFNCKVFGLVDGKKGNSFNVFFHVILILKLIMRT